MAKMKMARLLFHNVCQYGHPKIVEMLIQKSTEFNIDLNTKDEEDGMTGFQIANCKYGNSKVAETLICINLLNSILI